jgi:hypothetical protein
MSRATNIAFGIAGWHLRLAHRNGFRRTRGNSPAETRGPAKFNPTYGCCSMVEAAQNASTYTTDVNGLTDQKSRGCPAVQSATTSSAAMLSRTRAGPMSTGC